MKEKPANTMREMRAKSLHAAASREEARAKLSGAGVLAKDLELPPDLEPVADEELEHLGAMRPGARPSEEIVAEDRGR